MRLFFALLFLLMAMLPLSSGATDKSNKICKIMYKYTDEQNMTIISNTLPPEAIHKGYSILNAQGREQETVGPAATSQPAPSPTPIPAIPAVENTALLKMYENVQDIKQSKKEQVDAIENIEQVTLETIKHIQERIEYVKKMIAEYQLKKQPVPATLNERILHDQQAILENQAFLKRKKIEKHRIEAEYDTLIKNFEALNPPRPPVVGVPK